VTGVQTCALPIYLTRLLGLLADTQKTQTMLVQQFSALMLLPVNMRLIAARLEPQGGPISQISMNYKTASDEIARRLSSFVLGEANLSARMAAGVRRSLVLTHCAWLQAEVVARGNDGDSELDEQERRNEDRILREVEATCTRQAQDALAKAGREANDLSDASGDMRRMVLGLDTIRILGRVESRRDLMSEASMSATIDRIDEVQGEISEGLKMLNDLTSAIHLQLSLLQRPSTAVEAAEGCSGPPPAAAAAQRECPLPPRAGVGYQCPMTWTIPNTLTVLRLLAAPGVAIMFLYFHRPWADWFALVLFVSAAITDYFDGYLARLWKQE